MGIRTIIFLTLVSLILASIRTALVSQTNAIADSFIVPVTNTTSDGFLYASIPGTAVPAPDKDTCYGKKWKELYHAGHDYMASGNTNVLAVADGIVKYVAYKNFPGSVVIIEHNLGGNDKVYSMYGHLVKRPNDPIDPQPPVYAGQTVAKGMIIGQVLPDEDNSHLHFEIRTFEDGSFLCGMGPETFKESNGYTPIHPDFPYNANNIGSSGFDPNHDGYTAPNTFIANMNLTDKIKLFSKTFFRGNGFILSEGAESIFNLPFGPNQFGSIALPDGPDVPTSSSAIVFSSADGKGPWKYYTFSDIDARNDRLSDGSIVLNNISSVKNGLNKCLQPPGSVNAAAAVTMSSGCIPLGATPSPQPTQPSIDGIQLINPPSYEVSPGEGFNPSITIKVTSGQLDTGDYLHAHPEDNSNAFGAHPLQGVYHIVSTGNMYTFQVNTHNSFHMIAPQQTGTYRSIWRMHVNERDVGPEIVIPITVRTVSNPHPIDYWDAYYYNSKDLSGSVSHHATISDRYLFRNWGIGSPNAVVPVDNWSARFVREFNLPGGTYRFHCQHDDGCRILINGTTILDAWWDSSFAGHDWTGTLTPGHYEVKVEYYDQGGDARLDAWWQGPGFLPLYPPCQPDAWCGEYWGNKTLSGLPPLTKHEGTGFLNVGWGMGSPGYDLPSDNFSARFTRTLPFACGLYRFHVTADDGDRFYIDDVLKLDEWTFKGQYTTDVDVQLTEGNHTLSVDYYENGGDTAMRLSWDQLMTCAPSSGDLVVSSGQTVIAAKTQTSVSVSGTTATVGNSEGFEVGDKVLFHQTQGTPNAGKWEMAQIVAKNGTSWTLDHTLTNSYDSVNGRAQAVKIPRYTSITVQSGGTLTALPWNGSTGGILVFESDGNVTVDGTIDVTGKGFVGGSGSKRALNHTGAQGESYTGPGTICSSTGCSVQTNNAGGGGSGGLFAIGSGGGAGAGYSTAGTQAATGGASPGSTYGSAVLDLLFFGSGGGGGYDDGNGATAGGNGGNGGGIIFINAPAITVNGSIVADGAPGQNTANYSGGGGSGGSIYLSASSSLALGSDKVLTRGGNGGVNTIGQSGGNGGAGGAGRIRLDYCGTLSGSTSPPASVQQPNCAPPTSTATPTETTTPTPMPTATSTPMPPGDVLTSFESSVEGLHINPAADNSATTVTQVAEHATHGNWAARLDFNHNISVHYRATYQYDFNSSLNAPQPQSANFRLLNQAWSAGAGVHSSSSYRGRSIIGQTFNAIRANSANFRLIGGYEAGSQAMPEVFPGPQDFSPYSYLQFDLWTGSPMEIAIALGTGPAWTWYESPRQPLTNGNNTVQFDLQSSTWSADGHTGIQVSNLNDVRYLALLIYPSGNDSGDVFLDNIRLSPTQQAASMITSAFGDSSTPDLMANKVTNGESKDEVQVEITSQETRIDQQKDIEYEVIGGYSVYLPIVQH